MRLLPIILLLGVALSACATAPAYLEKPADPAAKVPRQTYQPVAGATRTFRPASPKGWEDLNRRVTPKS